MRCFQSKDFMAISNKFMSVRPPLPRAKIYGFIAIIISLFLASLFIYSVYFIKPDSYEIFNEGLYSVDNLSYFALAIPISLVTLFVIGTGFWIGWIILTIKVVPPMPEIVDKKDFSKLKAAFLCLCTLSLAMLLIYGIYIKSFWALAIPATLITLVILGAIFWVGVAIISTRSTLQNHKKES